MSRKKKSQRINYRKLTMYEQQVQATINSPYIYTYVKTSTDIILKKRTKRKEGKKKKIIYTKL